MGFFIKTLCALVFVIALVFMGSCKHEPYGLAPVLIDSTDVCDPNITYFQNTVLPIFQSNCAIEGCHDAKTAEEGIILSSYEQIINTEEFTPGNANESKIYQTTTKTDDGEDRMPPPPQPRLSSEQIASIRDWINQGARNNYCSEDCDDTKFSFTEIIQPLINTHCKGCHNSSLSNGGVNLENYQLIVASAADGSLLGTIKHDTNFIGMPYYGNKLSNCKISQVQKWIESGSPNN